MFDVHYSTLSRPSVMSTLSDVLLCSAQINAGNKFGTIYAITTSFSIWGLIQHITSWKTVLSYWNGETWRRFVYYINDNCIIISHKAKLPRAVVEVRVPRRPGAVEGERQLLVMLVLLTPQPQRLEHFPANIHISYPESFNTKDALAHWQISDFCSRNS